MFEFVDYFEQACTKGKGHSPIVWLFHCLSRFEPCSIHTPSNRISTDAMLALFHFAVFRDSKGIEFFGSQLSELRIGSIARLEKS